MKLRRYDRPEDHCEVLDKKALRSRNPKLSELSTRISISSTDERAFELLSGTRGITFKLGIGATEKTEVFLRNLAYAAIVLEIAREFDGKVEFVSGGGIASNSGLVDIEDVRGQIGKIFDLVKLLSLECYPDVKVDFSIPYVPNIEAIDSLVTLVEESDIEARRALEVLGNKSRQKGHNAQYGKRYGVLHTFAFDLRGHPQGSIVTVGNASEDIFNCIRYWTLRNINEGININGTRWIPPQETGHLITSRCKLPPYSNGQILGGFELGVTLEALEVLAKIHKLGRKQILRECDKYDDETLSNIGSVIKDFELLIRLVGIEAINRVIENFIESELEQTTSRTGDIVEVRA